MYYYIVAVVSFEHLNNSIKEITGTGHLVLVLSKPLSTDITVQVMNIDNTATSKLLTCGFNLKRSYVVFYHMCM